MTQASLVATATSVRTLKPDRWGAPRVCTQRGPAIITAEKAITWIAIACAGFAVSFFAGTALLRYMWDHQNA